MNLFELRNDKVVRVTEYFGLPFPPADWRAKWVERIETPDRWDRKSQSKTLA